MTSQERVRNCILGNEIDRQPIYGWVRENLASQISSQFGSVENFEDHYAFDAAHIFGGPWSFCGETFESVGPPRVIFQFPFSNRFRMHAVSPSFSVEIFLSKKQPLFFR